MALVDLKELTKFWETEDIIDNSADLSKDNWCETHYQKTTQRKSNGQYIVQMPLIPGFKEKLGKSKPIAISQFMQLERKFGKNPKLALMYKDFISEYINLGHMKLSTQVSTNFQNYLPHHGILREHSTTTKLRAVFNASQKTMGGYSLNDVMEKGPNLQKDIQALLIQWRTYKYVYTADIEKMYRCIELHSDRQSLQKIIWREAPSKSLQEFQMCTVTYGTKSAPWLAMRTLQQLADDDGHLYPEAEKVLRNQFYVDDLISGHNSIDSAKHVQQTLIKLLKGGGMNLRKWSSNESELLSNLSKDQLSRKDSFYFKSEETMKTLGLKWNPTKDVFNFDWDMDGSSVNKLTKRSLLSQISKLYDPLGWLAPITITAKLLFQRIWTEKLGIQKEWLVIKNELHYIKNIQINRWIGSKQLTMQLHGFCDASEKAYACIIYSQVTDENGKNKLTLLTAKTKVVPISQTTSMPRLELCGALLLSQLMEKVKKSLPEHGVTIHGWCDSKVVLAWIQGDITKWERYVANRVRKITSVIPSQQWYYVKSEFNPADCASRGLLPNKIKDFHLWWNGPSFLENFGKTEKCENFKCLCTTNEESLTIQKRNPKTDKVVDNNYVYDLLQYHSSLTQIKRVIAWILRFISKLRNKSQQCADYLITIELNNSTDHLIQCIQRHEFAQEYKSLQQKKIVFSKSRIYKLSPYLDEKGIIRVGGRLKKSNLPSNMKNPAIIPYSGRFTHLIIDEAHLTTLHGGARLTLSYLRQRYWIISGNRAVKSRL